MESLLIIDDQRVRVRQKGNPTSVIIKTRRFSNMLLLTTLKRQHLRLDNHLNRKLVRTLSERNNALQGKKSSRELNILKRTQYRTELNLYNIAITNDLRRVNGSELLKQRTGTTHMNGTRATHNSRGRRGRRSRSFRAHITVTAASLNLLAVLAILLSRLKLKRHGRTNIQKVKRGLANHTHEVRQVSNEDIRHKHQDHNRDHLNERHNGQVIRTNGLVNLLKNRLMSTVYDDNIGNIRYIKKATNNEGHLARTNIRHAHIVTKTNGISDHAVNLRNVHQATRLGRTAARLTRHNNEDQVNTISNDLARNDAHINVITQLRRHVARTRVNLRQHNVKDVLHDDERHLNNHHMITRNNRHLTTINRRHTTLTMNTIIRNNDVDLNNLNVRTRIRRNITAGIVNLTRGLVKDLYHPGRLNYDKGVAHTMDNTTLLSRLTVRKDPLCS